MVPQSLTTRDSDTFALALNLSPDGFIISSPENSALPASKSRIPYRATQIPRREPSIFPTAKVTFLQIFHGYFEFLAVLGDLTKDWPVPDSWPVKRAE